MDDKTFICTYNMLFCVIRKEQNEYKFKYSDFYLHSSNAGWSKKKVWASFRSIRACLKFVEDNGMFLVSDIGRRTRRNWDEETLKTFIKEV